MSKKIFLIAGEVSGDLLGGALIRDIKHAAGTEKVEFYGVGGADMQAQGMQSIFPMNDLSVMGLFEVIKHFPRLRRRFNQTIEAILKINPDIIVTIDAPDFGLRVAKKIKKLRSYMHCIHYVAPSVWAWRPKRAEKIAQFLDGVMCLFPFEPKYFTAHGLKAEFVGHPLPNLIPQNFDKAAFCQSYNLNPDHKIICMLPGSRVREIESLQEIMIGTIEQLRIYDPDIQVIIPTMPHIRKYLQAFEDKALIFIPKDANEKYNAFAVSDVALHASGTVALELALCNTPMVTVYKMAPLTAWIARRVIKTPFANLVNILLKYPVVPELLQKDANSKQVSEMVKALLGNDALNNLQREELLKIRRFLQEETPQSAARFILSF